MRRIQKSPLISAWVVLSAVGIGTSLFLLLLFFLWTIKPGESQSHTESTAVLTIVAAPTSTPPGMVGLLSSPTPPTEGPAVTIDGITQGLYVQIYGTGGDGLRLRKEAGISTPVLFLGYESEVFKVIDGPVETDGYAWWYLTAPYDENRSGWAASNFLKVVQIDNTP